MIDIIWWFWLLVKIAIGMAILYGLVFAFKYIKDMKGGKRTMEKTLKDELREEIIKESRDEIKKQLKEEIIKEEVEKLKSGRTQTPFEKGIKNLGKDIMGGLGKIDMDKWKERNLTGVKKQGYQSEDKSENASPTQNKMGMNMPDIEKFMKSKKKW